MKQILYCLPVDWDWIKQRPQFLAQQLAEKYEVFAVYCWQYRRRGLQSNNPGKVRLCPIRVIPPLGNRFAWLNKINRMICRIRLQKIIKKHEPEYLWLTFPLQIDWIPSKYRGKIIYDCMDYYAQLWPIESQRKEILQAECELCKRADLIFCSSQKLKEHLCETAGADGDKVDLLRNGCEGDLMPRYDSSSGRMFTVGYVGTISDWFDFSVIEKSLNELPDIEYQLIGPVIGQNVLRHERVQYRGVIEHKDLYDTVKQFDCLVMPFQRNSIVDAVDPVKLYEYISWQKPVVAVGYAETERFQPFVQLYSTAEEYCQCLRNIQNERHRCVCSEAQTAMFLKQNSWKARAEQVANQLK